MHRDIAVTVVICFLLCLAFNYTLPLHRSNKKRSVFGSYHHHLDHTNHSLMCDKTHLPTNVIRNKKMATNIENTLRKIKDSTQETNRNTYVNVNTGKRSSDKNMLSDKDLRQYEQLVMMKKYPYLDLKEFELKLSPPNKNTRQSVNFAAGSNIEREPSLCESVDEGPCIEITNRGLSGLAIPAKFSKSSAEQHNSNVNVKAPQSNEIRKNIVLE